SAHTMESSHPPPPPSLPLHVGYNIRNPQQPPMQQQQQQQHGDPSLSVPRKVVGTHSSSESLGGRPANQAAPTTSSASGGRVTGPRPRPPKKVHFPDIDDPGAELIFNARDSAYFRWELTREADFGIAPSQAARDYRRWLLSLPQDEEEDTPPQADTVVHPKRLSTDLSGFNVDLANLGDEVSGADVFSR